MNYTPAPGAVGRHFCGPRCGGGRTYPPGGFRSAQSIAVGPCGPEREALMWSGARRPLGLSAPRLRRCHAVLVPDRRVDSPGKRLRPFLPRRRNRRRRRRKKTLPGRRPPPPGSRKRPPHPAARPRPVKPQMKEVIARQKSSPISPICWIPLPPGWAKPSPTGIGNAAVSVRHSRGCPLR